MDLIRIIAAIVLPPLGVFLQEGLRKRFWINVVLTLLGYIPGIIHAVYVILKYEPRGRIGRGVRPDVGSPGDTRTPDYYRTDTARYGRSIDYGDRPSHA